MSLEDQVKAFGMTNMLLESDLENIEQHFEIALKGPRTSSLETSEIEEAYFPQFDKSLRQEALLMAKSYELFYCLERTIRQQVAQMLKAHFGDGWWNEELIPTHVLGEVKKRIKKEKESGFTPRSSEPLDYTTFGELSDIIKTNWSIFASVFNNLKALERVMSNLNTLRNPIAHCCMLAEDETLRLELSLRDWFRLEE